MKSKPTIPDSLSGSPPTRPSEQSQDSPDSVPVLELSDKQAEPVRRAFENYRTAMQAAGVWKERLNELLDVLQPKEATGFDMQTCTFYKEGDA